MATRPPRRARTTVRPAAEQSEARSGQSAALQQPGSDSPPDEELDHSTSSQLVASLLAAAELIHERTQRHIAAASGLNGPVFEVLTTLDAAELPLTPSQISERTRKSSATMTSTLDILERSGFARRTPNPSDRRSLLIEITQAGRDVVLDTLPRIRNCEDEALSGWSEDERSGTLDALGRLISHLDELNSTPIDLTIGRM